MGSQWVREEIEDVEVVEEACEAVVLEIKAEADGSLCRAEDAELAGRAFC